MKSTQIAWFLIAIILGSKVHCLGQGIVYYYYSFSSKVTAMPWLPINPLSSWKINKCLIIIKKKFLLIFNAWSVSKSHIDVLWLNLISNLHCLFAFIIFQTRSSNIELEMDSVIVHFPGTKVDDFPDLGKLNLVSY